MSGPTENSSPILTERELEVVGLVIQGYKNKEIAETLFISEHTIKNHLHNIFDKLGVRDRLELTLYTIANKLIKGLTLSQGEETLLMLRPRSYSPQGLPPAAARALGLVQQGPLQANDIKMLDFLVDAAELDLQNINAVRSAAAFRFDITQQAASSTITRIKEKTGLDDLAQIVEDYQRHHGAPWLAPKENETSPPAADASLHIAEAKPKNPPRKRRSRPKGSKPDVTG